VGSQRRSDVRSQGPGQHETFRFNERPEEMIAHRWERNLKDVGDQALMRGLGTAVPSMRPGLSPSYSGRRLKAGHKAAVGHSPAVAPPPPVREIYPPAGGWPQLVCASRATDHMNPTSSRAIAVQTTVVFFPRPLSAR
jgi:hypothetical protein